MKKASWTDQLSHSTKVTVVICGVLLALTAIAAVILMFFPIRKVDQPTVVVEPVRHTEYSTTTATSTSPQETTSTGRHTLSTWNAGVNGYSRSLDEFKDTEDPRYTTTDPRLWRATTATAAATHTGMTTSGIDEETPRLSTADSNHEQTVTTTVAQADPEPELTAPPLPADGGEISAEE